MDVLDALRRIMEQNTAFYQTDFRFDEDLIWKGALSQEEQDRALIWLSRPSGTYCFRERDTFLLDTWANSTLEFYAEHDGEGILAYAVEVTGAEGDNVFGNLYTLDFLENWKEVQQSAVRPDFVKASFQYSEPRIFPFDEYHGHFQEIIGHYGNMQSQEYLLTDPEPLRRLLAERKEIRTAYPSKSFPAHIRKLRERKVKLEAQWLLEELQNLNAPNSPDGTHFVVESSACFAKLADEKDLEALSRLLPVQFQRVTAPRGREKLYASISKDVDRSQLHLPQKTSVLEKLRQPAADKKPPASGKTKDQER